MAEAARVQETVLLVDDAPDDLAMLADAMAGAGFGVLTATSGQAGLTLAHAARPHLIVLDAVMPGLDGFETCRLLKKDAASAHIPVVFMTGLTETAHVVTGLEAGGVDYVTKPVITAELIARVRVHIANSRVAMGARIGLDATGRHLLAIDGRGNILWRTPQAAALLAARFPGFDPAAPAPDTLTRQCAALAPAGGVPGSGMLTGPVGGPINAVFLCESGPNEFIYRLTQPGDAADLVALQDRFRLTGREAEVLVWVSRGKSNREISEILVISPRTVNKHLERIFAKLGVENRASATSLAMQLLADRD